MNLLRRFDFMRAAARGTKFPWEISVRGGAVFLVQVDLLRFAAFFRRKNLARRGWRYGKVFSLLPLIFAQFFVYGLFGGAVLIIIRRGSVLGLPCFLDFPWEVDSHVR